MTLFIQLHLLTFVPPANLNRDDVGAPKTAMVGGDMRLRLSSQSLKRAWRKSDVFEHQLAGHLGTRTQRFGENIRTHLTDAGLSADKAVDIARKVIVAFGEPKSDKEKKEEKRTYTEQLAFLSPQEQAAALKLADAMAKGQTVDREKVAGLVLRRTDTAADIAMFGRMFANNPDFNREAAVQVAHAITTHRVAIEDDYYTAVDDLNLGDKDVGAGFVGEAGFGSGVFYLYACIDIAQLLRNLAQDEALAKAALAALVEAAATVAPNGKQASFASRLRASYVMVEKGSEQPRTLASAFAKAVAPHDALEDSKHRLTAMRDKFNAAYGAGDQTFRDMDVEAGGASLADLIAFATDWKA